MKTLRTTLLALVIVTAFSTAKATDKPTAAERLSRNYAINTYIDAMSRGRLDGVSDVVDATAKFSMLRGNQLVSFNKNEVIGFLKQNKGVEQTCTVNTSEVEANDNVTVVKVDMKFAGFVRSNYVTLANTGAGWKITSVYSVFK